MKRSTQLLSSFFALALVASACGDDDPEPVASGPLGATRPVEADPVSDDAMTDASASFAAPEDGATVARRFSIAMAADGVAIEPAGDVHEGAGHFHVMVDVGCVEPGQLIAKDDQHLHFGGGQLEAQLFLEPGAHELCLQVADGAHVALPITDEITVDVDADQPYVSLEIPEGESLASPVALTMSAEGVSIEPAGDVHDGAGHFHVMVDVGCVEPGQPIPKDDHHLHLGDGSTTADIELNPGEHTLCLQLGDGAHTALPLTHTVEVVVG